jgi:hypothetical protein
MIYKQLTINYLNTQNRLLKNLPLKALFLIPNNNLHKNIKIDYTA